MKKIIFLLIAASILVLVGCNTTQKTCNIPYVIIDTSCCLDQNENSICDESEKVDLFLNNEDILNALALGQEKKFKLDEIPYKVESPSCEEKRQPYCAYDYSYETLSVYTPYKNLAFEAAIRAKEYEDITEKEIKELASEDSLTIVLGVYGNSDYEAENAKAILKVDEKIIKAEIEEGVFARISDCSEYGCTWYAVHTFYFKNYSAFKDKEVKFILIRNQGEKEYKIDLSRYR